ncbi:MAG TPA: UDP-N-acetylmuramoyl-tripeptide--D-alanyl-D-alanine ligase [Solirubrobacteraceae bacterium]|jgi:UDP-N-acetylmuramoyl-tripeptide--D-alanyl-D-alanine ligase|nr:UDP-N-acetylmuramoyl-tripeptide--D-alanyl-D-alanine ligase [Solirubrobacteraceae bacterium]
MREWDAQRLAEAAGARLASPPGGEPGQGPGPSGAGVDTRALAPGELFVGLAGAHVDGGRFAARALRAGAWGVLVAPEHAPAAAAQGGGAVLVHEDPLLALHALALAWRRELRARGAKLVAITGSTGKTSTKDILAALLRAAGLRVAASPANHNTEIGMPLALLGAAADTQALVLELAMRGPGQIAQLTAIAEPDVGVIVNLGPAHLGLLGSLEAIAAAKAELIAGLEPGACAVLPAGEPLLAPHLRADVRTISFGEGGDVRLVERREAPPPDGEAPRPGGGTGWVTVDHGGERIELRPSFAQAHNLRNLLAAVAAARALGITPHGPLEVSFSAMRGQRERLAGGVQLIDDCYNANPMSMRAALDELAASAPGRRVAVLGDMLELGPQAPALHREIGEHAARAGVRLLVTVGPLAAQMAAGFAGETRAAADAREAGELVARLVRDGDTVLVKASRGVGLERVVERLRAGPAGGGAGPAGGGAGETAGGGARARAAGAGRR